MTKRCLVLWVCVSSCLVILAHAQPAVAHRINVFAWVEGETVHTESFFSDGTKAVNARIEVFGPDDTLLLEGNTDEEGRFVFEAPMVADLRIVLNESTGHRAEYDLTASEFGGAKPGTGEHDAGDRAGGGMVKPADDGHSHVSAHGHDHPAISGEEIRAMIEQVLEEKLSPIRAKLVSAGTAGPSLSEIIGGLGYIVGLMGIALYFKSRKNN